MPVREQDTLPLIQAYLQNLFAVGINLSKMHYVWKTPAELQCTVILSCFLGEYSLSKIQFDGVKKKQKTQQPAFVHSWPNCVDSTSKILAMTYFCGNAIS